MVSCIQEFPGLLFAGLFLEFFNVIKIFTREFRDFLRGDLDVSISCRGIGRRNPEGNDEGLFESHAARGFYLLQKTGRVLDRMVSWKGENDSIRIVEDVVMDTPKTKEIAAMLQAFELTGVPSLVLAGQHDPVLLKSCRNIPSVELQRSCDASAYQITRAKMLLIQKSALEPLYEVFGIGKEEDHPEAASAD